MSKDFVPGSDKPIWSLSSYGPAKYEPNLVSGLDESFEELRMKATLALKSNTGHEYVRSPSFSINISCHKNHRSNSKRRGLQLQSRSTVLLETTFLQLMSRRTKTLGQQRRNLQVLSLCQEVNLRLAQHLALEVLDQQLEIRLGPKQIRPRLASHRDLVPSLTPVVAPHLLEGVLRLENLQRVYLVLWPKTDLRLAVKPQRILLLVSRHS
jgi:hypothetical protein